MANKMGNTVLQVIVVVQLTISLTKAALEISGGSLVCPGTVDFNCTGTEVASTLDWLIDDIIVGTIAVRREVFSSNPLNIPLTTSLPGLSAQVIRAVPNADNVATIDITSILRAEDVSVLNGSSIQCQTLSIMDSTDVIILQTPPPPFTFCSLLSSPGGPEVTLQWSPSFTSQHAVEKYHVTVNPDPSTCSSDQVSPSEDYSCSGLSLGTNYSITVNAINCGNQEGPTYFIFIDLQVSQVFQVEALNFFSPLLDVQWRELSLAISGQCYFNGSLNYTIVLETSTGEMVDQRMISSDMCNDSICSLSFPISFSTLYKVSISVVNLLGQTSTITSYYNISTATTNVTAVIPTTATLLPRTDIESIDKITLELYQFILIIVMVILILLLLIVVIVVALLCKFKGNHKSVVVTDTMTDAVKESVIYDEIREPSFAQSASATKSEAIFELSPNCAYDVVLNKN